MRHRRVGVRLVLLAVLVAGTTWMYVSMNVGPTRSLLPTVLLSGQPVTIAVDTQTGRVLVTTLNTRRLYGVGRVSVLDSGTGKLLNTVTVGINPQALAIDRRTGRAVLVPQWLRWLPFLPQPAPPRAPGSVAILGTSRR